MSNDFPSFAFTYCHESLDSSLTASAIQATESESPLVFAALIAEAQPFARPIPLFFHQRSIQALLYSFSHNFPTARDFKSEISSGKHCLSCVSWTLWMSIKTDDGRFVSCLQMYNEPQRFPEAGSTGHDVLWKNDIVEQKGEQVEFLMLHRTTRPQLSQNKHINDEKCAPCHYQPNPLNPKTRLWAFSKKFLPALQGGNRQCGCLL
ncbi:MAG: hypothetical protein WAL98_20975 [Desulfatiglandaceae bacterium]